jgi:hypothetical protein
MIARMGEEILQDGKPNPEFKGWRLSELWKDRAVFTNRQGERLELAIESILEGPPAAARIGEAYHPEIYKSRRLAFTESREIWALDADEIEWATRNSTSILDHDFQITPVAEGGLRIESVSAGSMGAARGLKPGDVLREVNGRPLNSLADLRTILANLSRSGLQFTLDRAGRPFAIEYRPLPR